MKEWFSWLTSIIGIYFWALFLTGNWAPFITVFWIVGSGVGFYFYLRYNDKRKFKTKSISLGKGSVKIIPSESGNFINK